MLVYVGLCWFMLVYVGLCWCLLVSVGVLLGFEDRKAREADPVRHEGLWAVQSKVRN